MNSAFENTLQFLQRLSIGQRIALGTVVVGGTLMLVLVAQWASQPDYGLLFRNLDPGDANRIVENLRSDNIAFQLREDGTAVYVPRSQMHELRLRFAGEGMIARGQTGYELFDDGTIGMTDFMQRLNRNRALEGEMARTIANISQVESARVHLVMPERSAFREAQAKPTASVVVQLSNGGGLSRAQINGITALVAGGVEGMSREDVTVLDTRGNMLSNPDAGDQDAALTSNQLRLQRSVEEHLTEKGQTMLDRVVGPGNAIVRVSSRLDFSREVSESEAIDPETSTVISEERLDEEGMGGDNASSLVRNYDLSRTRTRSERAPGEISRLTVSVILNHRPAQIQQADLGEDGEAPEATPFEAAELEEIEALIKNAVGFDDARGDAFTIQQTRFDTSLDVTLSEQFQQQQRNEQIQLYLRYGLILVALLLAVWLIRSAAMRLTDLDQPLRLNTPLNEQKKLAEGDPSGDGAATDAPALTDGEPEDALSNEELLDDVYSNKLSPEARKRLKAKHVMYEEIREQVKEQPEETADLIRSWLNDDMQQRLSA